MSTETDTPNFHLPLALIACTLAVLLASQIGSSRQSTRIMKWQSETLQKQIENMQVADKQIAEAIKNRESVVKQSGEIQNQLQTLLNELLDLAKNDKDAAEIIKKWNVQRSTPPAGADAAAKPADAKKTP
jgi:uncharacterized protein YlxW (UPF0749 family)